MTFYSKFSDYNGKVYGLEMTVRNAQGADTNLTMSGNPCVIETSSSKLFDPIKSRSCSLEIVTGDWYFQLYEPTSRGTTVKVYEYDEAYEHGVKKVIFRGYLTPASYDQTWTYKDAITLEAVDAISTTKDFKWVSDGTYKTFLDIILSILQSDNINGYQGKLYVPRTYTYINENYYAGGDDVLDKLMSSSGNFIDDDDEHTPWTHYDILEEILKFLGWSLVPDGDDVWLIDYRAEGTSLSVDYSVYDIRTGAEENNPFTSEDNAVNVNLDVLAPGTTQVSIDDVYNKIEISDNLYKIDEISPDIFDDGYHINVTDEKNLGDGGSQWTKTKTTRWLFWNYYDTSASTEVKVPIGYDYQTFCRLNPASGWTHHFYRHSDLNTEIINEDVMNYFDQATYNDNNWNYKTGRINTYLNTHGCLVQHYAHVGNLGVNELPTSLDWDDILTFFALGPTSPTRTWANLSQLEKPVLEYNIDEEVQWKPSSGASWFVIKGDLFYQSGGTYDKKKKRQTLSIINTDENYYTTCPVDKAVDGLTSDKQYVSLERSRKDYPDQYGLGFSMWKMQMEITDGDDKYYWVESFNSSLHKFEGYWIKNPTSGTTTTFYLRYNNDPDVSDKAKKDVEFIPEYSWMNIVNNMDYKDKVGEDGYCIKIDSEDEDAPSKGKLKLTVFTPSIFPFEYIILSQAAEEWFGAAQTTVGWTSDLSPIIYCKGFELKYVYTDTQVWWDNHDNTNKSDRVYTGNINDDYVKTFDTIQMRINTTQKDQPISRSYVITKLPNGNNSYTYPYLTKMKHQCGDTDKEQEFNVVDAYLDHHSERKPIIEANVHDWQDPTTKYSKNYIDGTFVLDSQSWNVRENNNRIKIIAF